MTLAVAPLVAAGGLLAGSAAVRRAPDARAARAVATGCVAVTAAAAAAAMVAERVVPPNGVTGAVLFASGAGRWMPLVTLLAGLAATALAPVPSHGRRTFARILLILACGVAATAVTAPAAAVASWALSAFVVWRELRDGSPASVDILPAAPTHTHTHTHTGAVAVAVAVGEGEGEGGSGAGRRGAARLFGLHHLLGVGACTSGLLLAHRPGTTALAALLVTVGVGVRQCLLPLHLWHDSLARAAPPGILVAFTAGPAGLLLLPEITAALPAGGPAGSGRSGGWGWDWGWPAVAAALATALLGAGLGLVARDIRTALAQVSLALTGIVTCGALAGSGLAQAGAVVAWQVGAVATGGAVMIAAATEARRGPMALPGQGGCFARTPRLAVAFLLFGLTAVGYPATVGFIWEDLLLDGVGGWFVPLAGALVLAVAGSGATIMKWYFAGYTGRRDHLGEHDLTTREFRAVTLLLAVLLLAQVHPGLILPRY
ncbi:hypothetical protein CC117_04455 [Parafrankia colletiae]|uniref:NADH:quinone oxidoreductase/Mrp antiporter transmembrane domain-containing protein n=1 Tax=Parafrankia colletiae TaxID=573497 RepID=A0A1S1QRG0_9ACTN|nr:proton-conducting transporter membrane subunit [Parafrankia colletiae]MCK9902764.1 hypothetical protein [Frankia sp. Cpl3]OHV35885.1 hypothetical protein CC117_04455 [Parafrankia colletiae]